MIPCPTLVVAAYVTLTSGFSESPFAQAYLELIKQPEITKADLQRMVHYQDAFLLPSHGDAARAALALALRELRALAPDLKPLPLVEEALGTISTEVEKNERTVRAVTPRMPALVDEQTFIGHVMAISPQGDLVALGNVRNGTWPRIVRLPSRSDVCLPTGTRDGSEFVRMDRHGRFYWLRRDGGIHRAAIDFEHFFYHKLGIDHCGHSFSLSAEGNHLFEKYGNDYYFSSDAQAKNPTLSHIDLGIVQGDVTLAVGENRAYRFSHDFFKPDKRGPILLEAWRHSDWHLKKLVILSKSDTCSVAAVSSDESLIAYGTYDGFVSVYNAELDLIARFHPHQGEVRQLSFKEGDNHLFTYAEDEPLKEWTVME